jgi:kojibiose phosphorylase
MMLHDRTTTWEYREDRLLPESAQWRAALFTVGNGHLGTVGSFEEGFDGLTPATFINGLFVTPPGDLPILGAVPEWTGMDITVDAEPFRLDQREPAGFERVLDMRTGLVTRSVVWKGAESGVLKSVFRRTASMDDPGLVALDVTFTALTEPLTITVEAGIDSAVEGPFGALWTATGWKQLDADTLSLSARSIDGAHDLSVECRLSGVDSLVVLRDRKYPRFHGRFRLEPGMSRTVTKLVRYSGATWPNRQLPMPGTGVDDVLAGSVPHWIRRWETSRIDVEGDPGAERALRFAAFHLIAAAPSSESPGSIGARLLSGYGYRHHVFWDTDVYVVPYLTIAQPDLARNHLLYRHRGLDGARRKAARFGREGAFYAWEAADTGDDATPVWGRLANGDRVRIWTGELEEHITACVAWATDHYHRWTGDDEFMARYGAEMVLDGAKYWASRLEVEADGAHIRNVIGPNEYHAHVDDSFFTNVMAAWQLRRSVGVAGWLEKTDPTRLKTLLKLLSLPDSDLATYADLAEQVVLLKNAANVWEERSGFFDLDFIDVAAFRPSRQSLHDLLGDERTQEVQLVKQADVLMALVLLEDYGDQPGALAAAFDYYAPITDHGSSLSLAMHSLAASRIGRPEVAYNYFARAVGIDHDDAMGRGGQGMHAAAQGGILQAAIYGFGGLRLHGDVPQTSARLPEHWVSLGFSFVHNGVRHERLLK